MASATGSLVDLFGRLKSEVEKHLVIYVAPFADNNFNNENWIQWLSIVLTAS